MTERESRAPASAPLVGKVIEGRYRIEALIGEGRMTPAGQAAFDARAADDERAYSYEKEHAVFADDEDKAFRAAYGRAHGGQVPDVYAVQGYDAAQILDIGLTAVNGDATRHAPFAAALQQRKIDSPRGAFTLSRANNPVQDMYLRQVSGKENRVIGIAARALADPARGCKL